MIQAAIIAGGNLRVFPLTGITLPFVSYGGSSLLANAIVVGLLLLTLWAAVTLNFLLPRLMPGTPADAAIAKLSWGRTDGFPAWGTRKPVGILSRYSVVAFRNVVITPLH